MEAGFGDTRFTDPSPHWLTEVLESLEVHGRAAIVEEHSDCLLMLSRDSAAHSPVLPVHYSDSDTQTDSVEVVDTDVSAPLRLTMVCLHSLKNSHRWCCLSIGFRRICKCPSGFMRLCVCAF